MLRSLIMGKFNGPGLPVNPRRMSVSGVLCYRSIAQLPLARDRAVICTPAETTPVLIAELGERGARVAIVISRASFEGGDVAKEEAFRNAVLEAARPSGLRVVGPASTGVQVPRIGLNASAIATPALAGHVALISHSGSLTAGVVEWAKMRGIGFSHVVSAGNAVDLDVDDYLDYLGADASCRAILVCVRSISESRQFLSAARAVAQWRKVIVIKTKQRYFDGRGGALERAIEDAADEAFDVAIRRAGLLRVYGIDELFDAVETLASDHNVRGNRLAILSDGHGPAVIAADTVVEGGGRMAALTDVTRQKLSEIVAKGVGLSNPIDLGRGATAQQFARAAAVLLADPTVDSLLVMHTPTDPQPSDRIAAAIVEAVGSKKRSVLACWLSSSDERNVRKIFSDVKIPIYDTPDHAARGFLHLVRYFNNQEMLLQAPERPPSRIPEHRRRARARVGVALARGESLLSLEDARVLLDGYGIQQASAKCAQEPQDVQRLAEEVGFPVAVQLLNPPVGRISVKSTVLNLWWPHSVDSAVVYLRQCLLRHPGQEIPPIAVQHVPASSNFVALRMGMRVDRAFGPMIFRRQPTTRQRQ
ncbi:hypothetical protein CCP2SC5_1160006 [Azospirillaceae bacterium]